MSFDTFRATVREGERDTVSLREVFKNMTAVKYQQGGKLCSLKGKISILYHYLLVKFISQLVHPVVTEIGHNLNKPECANAETKTQILLRLISASATFANCGGAAAAQLETHYTQLYLIP